MIKQTIFIILTASIIFSGCATSPDTRDVQERTVDTLPENSENVVQMAVQDLTQRLGVPEDDIKLYSIEPKDWPDTSLGCPEEGMMYAQVITPGFCMVFQVDTEFYEYHSSYSNVVYCDDPAHMLMQN